MFSFLKRKTAEKNIRPDKSATETREFIRQTVTFLIEKSGNPAKFSDAQVTPSGQAVIILSVSTAEEGAKADPLTRQIEQEVLKLTGISKATVVITTEQAPQKKSPFAPVDAPKPQPQGKIPPVEHIIAVSSGKGGVGKSTVAVNLAAALKSRGKKVGILDADIYGPSLPRLMGIKDQKTSQNETGQIEAIESNGIKCMSMGFMVDEEAPMIWRGPMVQSALLQMIRDVNWSDIDVLLIDMPPGTGDIHLTLAQRVPLSGGVIVSTPQDIALIDARKGLEMFRKVAVPILGIIENMSYYCCPNCGHTDQIFGHGGAKDQAGKLGVPFLGEIPLHGKIRELSDTGTPIVLAEPDSPQTESYLKIADEVLKNLNSATKPAPRISMEE